MFSKDFPKRRIEVALAFGLLSVIVLVFGRSIFFPFLSWDDPSFVLDNVQVLGPELSRWFEIWNPTSALAGDHPRYLPFLESIYRVLYQWFGATPEVFHGLSLLTHFLASLLFFYLVSSLGFGTYVAGGASFLFALHPLHVESVAWVSGLKDPLSTVFLFSGFLLLLRSRSPWKFFLSALALQLALWSKGTSVVFLPLALLLLWWKQGQVRKEDLFRLLPHLLLTLVSIWLTVKVATANAVVKPFLEGKATVTFLTMLEVLAQYFSKLVMPVGLNAHYKPIPVESALSGDFVAAVGMIALGVLFVLAIHPKRRGAIFLAFWFGICLLPVSNLVPISMQMADRYLYVALGAYGIFLFSLIERLPLGPRLHRTLGVVLLLLYGILAIERVGVWESDRSLWKDAATQASHDTISWNNYGIALAEEGELGEAEMVFNHLVRMAPWKPQAWNNLGRVDLLQFHRHRNLARLEHAEEALLTALTRRPSYAAAHNNLGLVWWEKGLLAGKREKLEEAEKAFAQALFHDPTYGPALGNRRAIKKQLKALK